MAILASQTLPLTHGLLFWMTDGPFDTIVTFYRTHGGIHVDFISQSGSANGANAFAITKIETTDLATATAHPCMFVAP